MKGRLIIGFLFMLGIMGIRCQDVQIGYLITEYASYGMDSLVLRKDLDLTPPHQEMNELYWMYLNNGWATEEELKEWEWAPYEWVGEGEDYYRALTEQPWTSNPIEGIEGSTPIWCKIKSITSTDGDPDKLWECITVRGNGVIEVPFKHNVPPGKYTISLNFSNEGWSRDLNDCFTVIVE